MKYNKTLLWQTYIGVMGGVELDLSRFEDRRFLKNIFRMPSICGLKELGFLNIKDWCDMLEYIEEHDQ